MYHYSFLFTVFLWVVFICFPQNIYADQPIVVSQPLHEKPVLDATARFERKTAYVDDGSKLRQMNYYWYAPKPPYPDGLDFPLIVILHGSTGFSYAGKYLTQNNMDVKYPAFILVPMAPEGALWSYPIQVSNYTQELPHVVKLIGDLQQQYPIDQSRIYAVGCSMGGYGVFGVSDFYDHIFAAGVSISGEWFPDHAKNMLNMPMLILAGAFDTAVPIAKTRAVVKELKRLNAPIKYHEYKMNHNCPASFLYAEFIWKWLFSQQKKN